MDYGKSTSSKNNNIRGKFLVAMFFIILFLVGVVFIFLEPFSGISPIPENCRQMVIVKTPDLMASKGKLYRFERISSNSPWRKTGESIPIITGRNGLGWGRGLHKLDSTMYPRKVEGDGRSTAGVFELGYAFGFPDSSKLGNLNVEYVKVNKMLECIDDADSRYYNQMVKNNKVDTIDWNSSEVIRRSPTAYYLGIFVKHNKNPVEPGSGSCIFLHTWTAPDDSTAGCTTMSKDDMTKIVKWLNAEYNPVLVQLTDSLYVKYKDRWQLPELAGN